MPGVLSLYATSDKLARTGVDGPGVDAWELLGPTGTLGGQHRSGTWLANAPSSRVLTASG
jgi:hypothetical protein